MAGDLAHHQRDWDDLAALDPMWAILGDPALRFGRWDSEEFFASGERELAAALGEAAELGLPQRWDAALDFGCGLGRITRALAGRFGTAVGVDISRAMVARAGEIAAGTQNLDYLVNGAPDLALLGNRRFDLVWCRLVLQHQPSRAHALRYVGELVRVLAPGGLLYLQMPVSIPLVRRIEPRRRAYVALRRLGVPERVLYERLKLHPVHMTALPEPQLDRRIVASGGHVVRRTHDRHASGVVDVTLLVSR
jgi:SAM-dependent methyltransferase